MYSFDCMIMHARKPRRSPDELELKIDPAYFFFAQRPNAFSSSTGPVCDSSAPNASGNIDSDADQQKEIRPPTEGVNGGLCRGQRKKKKESTVEDKVYRSSREFVKRNSHSRLIRYFHHLGLRHPAAIRTHLEKVKHPEFELPNLQCVYPHAGLSLAFDEKQPMCKCRRVNGDSTTTNVAGKGKCNEIGSNVSYYNLYCATTVLIERVEKIIGVPDAHDPDYSRKVLT